MRERIEFITESTIRGRKEIAKVNEYVNNFNFDCEFKRKIEQVPESFAELKALFLDKLKELNVEWFGDRFVENKSEEFWVQGILFKAAKTLSIRDDNDNIRVIMTNIDYPLMWVLIQTTLINIKSNHL